MWSTPWSHLLKTVDWTDFAKAPHPQSGESTHDGKAEMFLVKAPGE